MLHYSCDVCKRPIDPQSDVRHVVKIEVFTAIEDQECCGEADVLAADADHLEEVEELLDRIDADECDDLDDARSIVERLRNELE